MSIRKKGQVIKSMEKCQEHLRNAKLQAMTAQVRDDREEDKISAAIDKLIIDIETPLTGCQSVGEATFDMMKAEVEEKERGKGK